LHNLWTFGPLPTMFFWRMILLGKSRIMANTPRHRSTSFSFMGLSTLIWILLCGRLELPPRWSVMFGLPSKIGLDSR
jgi:hypothetical protein